MKNRNIQSMTILIQICLLFSISSCKKSTDDNDQFPIFGTCEAVAAKGHLTFNSSNGTYTYKTRGGGTIVINSTTAITISHADYVGFSIDLWGGFIIDGVTKLGYNHENLNGKHVKDKIAKNRTILFPDGAKITITADSIIAPVLSISIYDGKEAHRINLRCSTRTIEWSTASSEFTQQIDNAEADGETGGFRFTATGLVFDDYYIEQIAGNKVQDTIPIGEIFRSSPSQVNDYWP